MFNLPPFPPLFIFQRACGYMGEKVPGVFSLHGGKRISGLVLVLRYLPAGGISPLFLVIVPPTGLQCCLWWMNLWSILLLWVMLWMGQLGLPLLLLAAGPDFAEFSIRTNEPVYRSLSYRIKFSCTADPMTVPQSFNTVAMLPENCRLPEKFILRASLPDCPLHTKKEFQWV